MKIAPLAAKPLSITVKTDAGKHSQRASEAEPVITHNEIPNKPNENPQAANLQAKVVQVEELPGVVATQNDKEEEDKDKEATDPNLDPKFAHLARQTKALRVATEKFRLEKEAFEKAKVDGSSDSISKADLQSDTLSALAKAGISYDALVERLLNQKGELPEHKIVDPRDEKLLALEKRLEAFEASSKQNSEKAYQDALASIDRKVKSLVDTDPAFETIKARGEHKEVTSLIEKHYKEFGEILSETEAASQIEELLVEKTADELTKYSALKKIQDRLKPKASEATPAKDSQMPASIVPKRASTPTLTNHASSTRPLTARERAVLAFKGELKP